MMDCVWEGFGDGHKYSI